MRKISRKPLILICFGAVFMHFPQSDADAFDEDEVLAESLAGCNNNHQTVEEKISYCKTAQMILELRTKREQNKTLKSVLHQLYPDQY